ncbi:hypothetical protein JIN77_00150 [Verrucomicrobiaceae bacterium R5-34]|uniref:Uncharacterized protein n=1 Tax=Oceaniferula flava TaxID=2800421 RepID=A0AAE2SBE2_9BACT|nr:hypothetical protein [Oceaniferula flavus]MBK1829124.1 hypothetical protein [Verrucomicrobiaceae bacterium R5-34]MBK1853360.1 hypothetical protein [Oceaniferula flavus]MBM1134665.1 hypothetical protein [Oceaniferula flavus]
MKTTKVKELANQLSHQTTDAVSESLGVIRKKPVSRTLLGAICVCAGALFLASCEKEGPAERAGEKMDNAVEEAGDKVEEATD